MKARPHLVGITFGLFMAVVHALWSFLVFMGSAKAFLDFIFGLHFLSNPYSFHPFNTMTALTLVVVTFIVGYLGGYIGSIIWNWAMKK